MSIFKAVFKGLSNLFECAHPANRLVVYRNETAKRADDDFKIVTYHLMCCKCSEPIELSYAKLVSGVDGFLGRELKEKGGAA